MGQETIHGDLIKTSFTYEALYELLHQLSETNFGNFTDLILTPAELAEQYIMKKVILNKECALYEDSLVNSITNLTLGSLAKDATITLTSPGFIYSSSLAGNVVSFGADPTSSSITIAELKGINDDNLNIVILEILIMSLFRDDIIIDLKGEIGLINSHSTELVNFFNIVYALITCQNHPGDLSNPRILGQIKKSLIAMNNIIYLKPCASIIMKYQAGPKNILSLDTVSVNTVVSSKDYQPFYLYHNLISGYSNILFEFTNLVFEPSKEIFKSNQIFHYIIFHATEQTLLKSEFDLGLDEYFAFIKKTYSIKERLMKKYRHVKDLVNSGNPVQPIEVLDAQLASHIEFRSEFLKFIPEYEVELNKLNLAKFYMLGISETLKLKYINDWYNTYFFSADEIAEIEKFFNIRANESLKLLNSLLIEVYKIDSLIDYCVTNTKNTESALGNYAYHQIYLDQQKG